MNIGEEVAESHIKISTDGETHRLSQCRRTSHLRLIDYASFCYLGILTACLIFFHTGLPFWPILVVGNLLTGGVIWLFTWYVDNKGAGKSLKFLRDAYPFFLYTFVFKETSLVLREIFPFWLEPHLIQWDLWLFGVHPTVWVESLFTPVLTEVMAFSYWSYYVFVPGVGILLYLRNRLLFHRYAFHATFTLYTCYFLFLFLTARSPQETLGHLHEQRALVGFFDHFVAIIQRGASISGAAFPSSHVAAQWIAWLFLFKFSRGLALLAAPVVVALTLSVVYMQYHYAVDAIGGVLIIFATYPLGKLLEQKFQNRRAIELT